jgi:nucleoside-diphosphate-sugar epimerase
MATETVSGATVVVTGSAGELGRAVCELVAADPSVATVIAVDRFASPTIAGVTAQVADLGGVDLKPLFEGAQAVLHLAQADEGDEEHDARVARRVLDAAGAVGVEHLVLLSSAAAYGAWANNPVPLTEDAALRPNPGVALASAKAEIERAAADFRDAHPGTTVTLLRPVPTVSSGGRSVLAELFGQRGSFVPLTQDDPPAQLLTVTDLASAVDLARRQRIDGPRNVAPDGWLDGATARSLAGGRNRFRWPERIALLLSKVRWRQGMGGAAPELMPLLVHPWVVANDRLKADGWRPVASNEEAASSPVCCDSRHDHDHGTRGFTSTQRAEAQLAGTALLVAGVVVGLALRRRRRRRT